MLTHVGHSCQRPSAPSHAYTVFTYSLDGQVPSHALLFSLNNHKEREAGDWKPRSLQDGHATFCEAGLKQRKAPEMINLREWCQDSPVCPPAVGRGCCILC